MAGFKMLNYHIEVLLLLLKQSNHYLGSVFIFVDAFNKVTESAVYKIKSFEL